jgi:hypothetical protein
MSPRPLPAGLRPGGATLWESVTSAHELDEVQAVQLLEACRAKDRLDQLDELLRGDIDVWARLTHRTRTEDYELKIDDAAKLANATANQMKQLLASLRLADDAGKRPQQRGGARGSYAASAAKAGKVSSLDRARAAKSGA